jgi:hypothetical protein
VCHFTVAPAHYHTFLGEVKEMRLRVDSDDDGGDALVDFALPLHYYCTYYLV